MDQIFISHSTRHTQVQAYWGFGIDDVTVREINSEANFITFSFTEQTGAATIDDGAHTIDIEVANGTDMTNLVASYTLSSYATTAIAGTDQESGVTANNFSSPVTYTVTAEDGSTQNWVVYCDRSYDSKQ